MNAEQMKVRKFFKEFWSWKAENVGMWLGSGIIEVLFGIMMMIPYPEIQADMGLVALPLMFGFFGPMLYMVPYITFREGQNTVSIYEKLKYLPIDYKEIKKLRLSKLVLFVAKIFPIIFICQLFFTYFGYGHIRTEDVIYAVLVGLVWPVVSNLPYAWFSK